MIKLNLGQIAGAINAKVLDISHFSEEVCGISIDSRTTKKGDIFFALTDKRDGHDFASTAVEKGAVAVVVAKKLNIPVPQLFVLDPTKAIGQLAKWYRQQFDIRVIAVTGSVGKTTAREMIKTVLSTKFEVVGAPGNFNNLIGLPLAIFAINEKTEVGVFELGINQPGEMEILADIVQADVSVITRIAPVHLELLGTLENIAAEKTRLFAATQKRNGQCIFNLDDDILKKMVQGCKESKLTFGVEQDADISANNVSFDGGKAYFSINENRVSLKALGIHNIYNALAAYAVSVLFEITPQKICQALTEYEPYNQRLKKENFNGIVIIDDSYNASPVAVNSGLSTISMIDSQRRIAVLGDMLELGLNEVRYHCEVLQYALGTELHAIYLIGNIFRDAYKELLNNIELHPDEFFAENVDIIHHFNTNEELKQALRNEITSGDLVFFKGSKKMQMNQYIKAIKGEGK